MTKERVFTFLGVLLIASIVYIPLNGLIGLLLAHHTGSEYWKLVPTVIMTGLAITIIGISMVHQRALTKKIFLRPYNILALVYIAIVTLYSIPLDGHILAHGYGWLIDSRYVLVFIAAQIICHDMPKAKRRIVLLVIFGIAVAVALVALAEAFVPNFADSLINIGYWVTNLKVDENSLFGRASGTLRGPNELGAYMAAMFFVGLLLFKKHKLLQVFFGALIVIAVYVSYSRSAYLGLLCGIVLLTIVFLFRYRQQLLRKAKAYFVPLLVGSVVIVGGAAFAAHAMGYDTKARDYISIVIFHNDPNSVPGPNSDDMRLSYWHQAINAVMEQPLGHGTGSTGLASVYMGRGSVTENYYLQILVEIGVIGFIVFLIFLIYTLTGLLRCSPYIGASLLSVLVATAFLHTMADEAVATVLWFICGMIIVEDERTGMGLRTFLFKLKRGTEEENYGRDNIAESAAQHATPRLMRGAIRVIDLGAGYGTDLDNIKKLINSPNAVYEAIENWEPYRKELRSRGIKSYSRDIERDQLPFKDASVDIVVANQIIEHTKEIFWIFNEIHRVLKPGGIALIGVPNIASFHNRVAMIFGMQPTSIELYSAHVRGITAGSFRRFIEKGEYFKLEKVQGANFYPFPRSVARILSKVFPTASVGITLRVRKTDKKGHFITILENANFETPFYTGVIPKE